jgi:hypothetical protein
LSAVHVIKDEDDDDASRYHDHFDSCIVCSHFSFLSAFCNEVKVDLFTLG